jgi:hypothetical protein
MFGRTTFVGRVRVYENGAYLWSESTGINRIHEKDALDDAARLSSELLDLNSNPINQ